MLNFFRLWLVMNLVICRLLVMSLPIFEPVRSNYFFLNLFTGLASDLSYLASFFLIIECLASLSRRFDSKAFDRFGYGLIILFIMVINVAMVLHLRYVEHFGMTVRPVHLMTLKTGGVQSAGPGMLFESGRTVMLMFLPIVFALLVSFKLKAMNFGFLRSAVVLLIVGVAANATNLQFRYATGVHKELRHNPFAALYYNNIDYNKIANQALPEPEALLKLRDLFQESRVWAKSEGVVKFPLWQSKVAEVIPSSEKAKRVQSELATYIEKGRKSDGDWNVVVILLESAIARFISSLNDPNSGFKTPFLDEYFSRSVLFTEAIASGLQTKDGQISGLCSLYSIPNFPLMSIAPMVNANCLSDIFADKGYTTSFYHSADNHFDNKDIFHQKHKSKNIFDENSFVKNTPKGGWGFSDYALFKKVEDDHDRIEAPFFTIVLSLTNHPPFLLPTDSPEYIGKLNATLHQKIIRYMDWSFGEFMKSFEKKHPHTIFVITSDQGIPHGGGVDPTKHSIKVIRQFSRIPIAFYIPEMPKSLRGQKFSKLISNADIPPTLLNLMKNGEVPNQFMGIDAFTRKTKIYTNWFSTLLSLEESASGVVIEKVDTQTVSHLGALGHYNLFAPSQL